MDRTRRWLGANRFGTNTGALCKSLYEREGPAAVRRILGVLNLAKKYGAASCDEACQLAVETGAGGYRFVRKYLERRQPPLASLRQLDPIIRQLTLYRDLIDQRSCIADKGAQALAAAPPLGPAGSDDPAANSTSATQENHP